MKEKINEIYLYLFSFHLFASDPYLNLVCHSQKMCVIFENLIEVKIYYLIFR